MITLRQNQTDAADAVEDAFRNGIDRPLVDSCVASGKSMVFAELGRRETARGGRMIIGAHTRELVKQNASACRLLMPGVHIGINAAALGERTWRAPIISAAIQSIHKYAQSFGPISLLGIDEAHLVSHGESGMYNDLIRGLGFPRVVGGSGTVFRLQGGSLVEGEGAPFQRVVYRYTILDGIRDGILCPAYSLTAADKMDPEKLRTGVDGDYSAGSQDAQMIALMDSHIMQMVHYRSRWKKALVFEASTKAAKAMCERLIAWGFRAALVLGTTPAAERERTIAEYGRGQLDVLVNVAALTTGFDDPGVDLLVMRRRTKSLGLYIQMVGRLLRCIGGTIAASIAAGKAEGAVLDFAGNIEQHGPLDFIRPKESKVKFVNCDACNKRNPSHAGRCWACDEPMLKNCPACLVSIPKHEMDCPACRFDMRAGPAERKEQKLFDVPSGAALISNYRNDAADKLGGWLAIRKVWTTSKMDLGMSLGMAVGPENQREILKQIAALGENDSETVAATNNGDRVVIPAPLAAHAVDARWIRHTNNTATAILCPNGASRSSARQISGDGSEIIVPMPAAEAVAA